eukprot:1147754-Pelagomonas_calceolata.AAC.3
MLVTGFWRGKEEKNRCIPEGGLGVLNRRSMMLPGSIGTSLARHMTEGEIFENRARDSMIGTVPESRAEAFIKAKHQTASTPPISPRCFSTMLSVCADCRVVPSCTLGAV